MPKPSGAFTFKPDNHYIVDFSAALNFPEFFDPNANLPERHIIISRTYQRKLYDLRDENSDRGVAAYELSNLLDNLITEGTAEKNDGAMEYHLGNLHVIMDFTKRSPEDKEFREGQRAQTVLRDAVRDSNGDNIKDAIMLAYHWKKQNGIKHVVILTNDSLMKFSTQNLGDLDVCMFSPAPFVGYRRIVNQVTIDYWRKSKDMPVDVFFDLEPDEEPLRPHEFVMFGYNGSGNSFNHIGRYDARTKKIVRLRYYKDKEIPGAPIKPAGETQAMAYEALMAPPEEIRLVILYGQAGTGKTYSAMDAGYKQSPLIHVKTSTADFTTGKARNGKQNRKQQQAMEAEGFMPASLPQADTSNCRYQYVAVCPPDRMLGDKMAAVPGDERAKLAGKMGPYYDNLRAILHADKDKEAGGELPDERGIAMRAKKIMDNIQIEPPGHISGRSLTDTFFICDESQFCSLAQIKSYIERVNTGSKMALLGDPSQISNPYGWYGNPLARAVRYLGNDPDVAIIRFDGNSKIIRPGAIIVSRSWPKSR